MSLFLHGGGGAVESFRPFTEICPKIALISYDEEDESLYAGILEILLVAGAQAIKAFGISKSKPLDMKEIEAYTPDGIFVCGGLTPDYHAALCNDARFLGYLQEAKPHYCGTSAGAMIASKKAIVGGWRIQSGNRSMQMIFQGAGEDLELLEIRDGLGLLDAAIDVHASQWGTLTRLIHAVDTGAVSHGYAIDENTMLLWDKMTVHGEGQVYQVTKEAKGVQVSIMRAKS